MAEQTSDDKPKTATPPKTTQAAPAPAPAPARTGEEPDPRGVHRPGRPPGEFTDHGPVTMPVRQK